MYAASEGSHSIPNSTLDGDESLRAEFSGGDLIYVAPHPIFAGFDGADEGVVAVVEVTGCVHVLRRITAADVTTFQTHAEMNPCVSHLDALRADVFVSAGDLDLVEM
jgi:hypothetical protein